MPIPRRPFLALAPLALPGQARSQAPSELERGPRGAFRRRVLANGLEHPWGGGFLPDGRLLLSERPGRARLMAPDGTLSPPLAGLPEVVAEGQGGLLDLQPAPDFAQTAEVFFTSATLVEGGVLTRLSRARLTPRGFEAVQPVLDATPAQLRLMVEAGGATLPLGRVLVGGSKLDAGLRAALAEMAPAAVVHEFYGAAEASFITLSGPACPEGSVGRPYPGVEIALEAGEIWVRSPYLFQGYAGDDPGGARWRAGWLSVGEMGRMEGGFLYLQGRAGRMVTVADQNVFPEEIEAFLMGLPGVARAAVLPRPDGLRGVHLVAVLLGSGDTAAVLAASRAAFGSLKAPRAVHWVEDWPMLPSGKTDLAALERGMGWR